MKRSVAVRVGGCWAAALALAVSATPAPAQQIGYSGSVQYASGRYVFAQRMQSYYLFNALSLRAGRLELSASLPLVLQNSSAVTYVAGMPVPTGGPESGAVQRRQPGQAVPTHPGAGGGRGGGKNSAVLPSFALMAADSAVVDSLSVTEPGSYELHLGDPVLGAGLELYQGGGALRSLGVSAAAKAPLASVESGVGTGEWDYGAGASLVLGAGRLLLFGDLGYWVLGDLPGLELKDNVSYGAGLGLPLGSRTSLMASLAGSTEIIASMEAPLSAGLSLSFLPAPGRSLSLGTSFGLSEAAADLSVFIGWGVELRAAR